MMEIEAEIRDIKQHVIEISKKLDELMYEREITAMMKLCLLYTSPSPRDLSTSRMPSSA